MNFDENEDEEVISIKAILIGDVYVGKTSLINVSVGMEFNPSEKTFNVTFEYDSVRGTNVLTLYVNVNYAPSQLEDTMYRIYQNNIHCVCDFDFIFFQNASSAVRQKQFRRRAVRRFDSVLLQRR